MGEDARARRLYLPLEWLDEVGMTPEGFFAAPKDTPEVRRMVKRLLSEARRLYIRSEAGIGALPLSSRSGIFAARYIYAGIGQSVKRNGYDSITQRGHTSKAQKLGWLMRSGARAAGTVITPRSPVIYAAPLPEVRFLVEAAAGGLGGVPHGRAAALLDVLAGLKTQSNTSGIAAE